MSLSIVIPAKNEQTYLPLLFASIRGQTYQPLEIIVADAKSSDKTCKIAKAGGATIIEGGMPGPGRNRGAEVAKGDYIYFFDADVLLPHPKFLEDCLKEMMERGLDVATCSLKVQDGTLLDDALHSAYNVYAEAVHPVLQHATGCCILTKRSVHQAIGGFDESVVFAEDHDYIRRAAKAEFKTGILHCHKILISPRRYRKEGMMRTAAKFMWCEAYILMKGPFRKMPFTYEFGSFNGRLPNFKRTHTKKAKRVL